jgi:hypothetical protein
VSHPPRPLGVSLAILAGVVLFTLLPLMQVCLLLNVQQHFLSFPERLPDDPEAVQPLASGVDILGGINSTTFVVQGITAIIFLVIAVFAWRGRPSYIRWVMVLVIPGITVFKFLYQAATTAQYNLSQGISSGDSLLGAFNNIQFVMEFLVMLYVAWYMNRAAARAFYRGSYAPPSQSG